MRKLLILILTLSACGSVLAQTSTVVFEWQYINVIDGYDHESKMEFYVDDVLTGESTVTRNSEKNTYTINVEQEGVYTFSAQNWALYEGNWEEVLVANEYSMDAQLVISLQIKPGTKRKISIIFDIDSQKVITVSVN